MGRAPCCEKMGLKKGPWSQEEDQVLTSYIKLHGHGNWRALPKQAGLLRCGKSCRLRWINYLRPDIKRGNFTREEEDTIIKLHEMLGNRWSAIAARLPGRTDNEIKNVWHTHLKKRLKQKDQPMNINNNDVIITDGDHDHDDQHRQAQSPAAPPQESITTTTTTTTTSSDMSSVTCCATAAATTNTSMEKEPTSSDDEVVEIDEKFWTEVLSADNSTNGVSDDDGEQQRNDFNKFSSASAAVHDVGVDVATPELGFGFTSSCSSSSHLYGNMDFWYNLFTAAGDSQEMLAQF